MEKLCEIAEENGQTHILQYCYDEGLEWDEYKKFGVKMRTML